MLGEVWSHLRNTLYDRGWIKGEKFPELVISVGNLTWGGTGKTSLVQELVRFLLASRHRVAIVSRGYGRRTHAPVIVSDGKTLRCSWSESGDEPFLLATELRGAIVAVSEKKAEGIRMVQQFGPDVIVLDDAFQHRKVKRDLDVVLVDASEDILSLNVLPFGKLREPAAAISRANAVILTHSTRANRRTLKWVDESITSPTFRANYIVSNPESVSQRKVAAFCAIGSPQHFYSLLKEQGAELVALKSFRDHHVFSTNEIESFLAESSSRGAEIVVTTAKDAVRLEPEMLERIQVIRVKLQITEESLFFAFLSDALKREKSPQAP